MCKALWSSLSITSALEPGELDGREQQALALDHGLGLCPPGEPTAEAGRHHPAGATISRRGRESESHES